MTAPSSPVTLVYGSKEYDELLKEARGRVAAGLDPGPYARALLAADERARAAEAELRTPWADMKARAEAAEARCAAEALNQIRAALTPPAPEGKPQTEPLTVVITDDQLVISIGVQTLGFAATRGPYFDRLYYEGRDTEPVITDAMAFAKAILTELKDEEEDGTTLVHRMLDKAAENAVEQGAEGIRLPGEKP